VENLFDALWQKTAPQWIGTGYAQLIAPSFAAIKADETGISILGRKVVDFPFPKIVDKALERFPSLGKFSEEARDAADLRKKLTALELEAKKLDGIQSMPAAAGKGKNASNAAAFRNTQQQIESLEASVKLLAQAIGI
jgi:hypothetical protein